MSEEHEDDTMIAATVKRNGLEVGYDSVETTLIDIIIGPRVGNIAGHPMNNLTLRFYEEKNLADGIKPEQTIFKQEKVIIKNIEHF